MGLMREARRAGIYPAEKATALRSKIFPAKVAGSIGSVPNSIEAMPLATANDGTVPIAIPRSASRAAVAPRAMRIPIS
jgi:hypothetical protein